MPAPKLQELSRLQLLLAWAILSLVLLDIVYPPTTILVWQGFVPTAGLLIDPDEFTSPAHGRRWKRTSLDELDRWTRRVPDWPSWKHKVGKHTFILETGEEFDTGRGLVFKLWPDWRRVIVETTVLIAIGSGLIYALRASGKER